MPGLSHEARRNHDNSPPNTLFSDGLPSQEYLRYWFDYSETLRGLVWKRKPNNTICVGELTGSTHKHKGYRLVHKQPRSFYIHRMVYKFFHGPFNGEIDHINGIRDDNRISNLRVATSSQNSRNSLRRNRTSRLPNVWKQRGRGQRWECGIRLCLGGHTTKLGAYKLELAAGICSFEGNLWVSRSVDDFRADAFPVAYPIEAIEEFNQKLTNKFWSRAIAEGYQAPSWFLSPVTTPTGDRLWTTESFHAEYEKHLARLQRAIAERRETYVHASA